MLQAYNCDKTKPGEKRVEPDPAEKQIYRPDYVLHHFVHYSLATEFSVLNKNDTIKSGFKWNYKAIDPLSRFSNEGTEALMLHAKAIGPRETNLWEKACLGNYTGRYACRLGNPFPKNWTGELSDENGIKYNCYMNHKIEDYWASLLRTELKRLTKSEGEDP